HVAALRAIPHLFVIRPADPAEVSEAWRIAIRRRSAPTALALTRQKVGVIDRSRFAKADGLRRGGYILAEAEVQSPKSKVQSPSEGDNSDDSVITPQLILIATGSEVSLALEAREKLQADGIATRVVSMPCTELFDEQDQKYRAEVLPANVTARVSIEAARLSVGIGMLDRAGR